MPIYAHEIIGRIAKKVDVLRTDSAREYTIAKILKYEHLNLHMVMPHIVRDYRTAVSDPITISGTPPTTGLLTGVAGTVDISTVEVDSTAVGVIEIHSVISSDYLAPYRRVKGLEHFANFNISDESGTFGRYWWPARGAAKVHVYRGAEVTEDSVRLGITREFDTSYADIVSMSILDQIVFDAPHEALSFIVSQVAAKVLEDQRAQIPEWLSQDIQNQLALVQTADANMAQQLAAMEKMGGDSLR